MPLVQLVVDELRGGAPSPSKGDNALRCARVLDEVLWDYYGNRDDGFYDNPGGWLPARLAAANDRKQATMRSLASLVERRKALESGAADAEAKEAEDIRLATALSLSQQNTWGGGGSGGGGGGGGGAGAGSSSSGAAAIDLTGDDGSDGPPSKKSKH